MIRVESGAFRRLRCVFFCGFFLVLTSGHRLHSQVGPTQTIVADGTVDFATEIQPILENHCYRCHGAERSRGGLRLDTRNGALLGGDSGDSILSPDSATNVLYGRITTELADLRMPLGEDPLLLHEVQLIRSWIEQGAAWPVDPAGGGVPFGGIAPWSDQFRWIVDLLLMFVKRRPYWIGIFLLVGLVAVRSRQLLASGHRVARSTVTRLPLLLFAGVRVSHGAVLLLGIVVFLLLKDSSERERTIGYLRNRNYLEHRHVFGVPAKPFRPSMPKSMSMSYYRGNCERRSTLFNQGNYRTATLHLRLRDGDNREMDYGDKIPDSGLVAELEIVRAPHAAEGMFSEKTMGQVFLNKNYYSDRIRKVEGETGFFETVEAGNRWIAGYPLDVPTDRDGQFSDLIYVYLGKRSDSYPFRPVVHYGITYDLVIENGRLAQGSDLWLGNLFWTSRLAVPRPDDVPIEEWFSVEPIPEMVDVRERLPNRGIDLPRPRPADG